MKNLFSIILAIALCTGINAGASAQVTTTDPDTITNSDTATATVTPGGGSVTVGYQIVVTKISGTVAGTCVLMASIDGDNFEQVQTSDTLALTDVTTNTHIWSVTPSPYATIRCRCIGSGTMSAQIVGSALRRD